MTPPHDIRNFFLGRSSPLFEFGDTAEAMEGLQDQARSIGSAREASATRLRDASEGLTTLGAGGHGDTIVDSFSMAESSSLESMLESVLHQANSGERRSYYDALRIFFVVVHRSLEEGSGQGTAVRQLHRFLATVEDYSIYLRESSDLSSAEKFRFLFAAAQVVRTMLGRVDTVEEPSPELEIVRQNLRDSLISLYSQLENYHDAMLMADPDTVPYTGVLREVQMRRALLENHLDVAFARAEELSAFYQANPPPDFNPEDPATGAWDVRAARALVRDPDFLSLSQQLDQPSAHEDTASLLNGIGFEVLRIVGTSIDLSNEEEESAIQSRYEALSLAISALSLTLPGMTLRQMLELLADQAPSEQIQAEIQGAIEGNETLTRQCHDLLGDRDISTLLPLVREAALHLRSMNQGTASHLLETVLHENERPNQIHHLAEALEGHPEMLRSLGIGEALSPREAAAALFRRGSVAIERIRQYGAGHPGEEIQGIVTILESDDNRSGALEQFSESLLDSYEMNLDEQPDHLAAAIGAVAQSLAHTEAITDDLSLSEHSRTRARELTEHMEDFWFRAGRVRAHLLSPTSIATVLGGALVSRLLPAMFLTRAGEAGQYSLLGMELVNAGRLTRLGATVSGLGTGLAISAISTGMHCQEQRSLGLETHVGRDFLVSAGINMATFGATMRFSQWYANALRPAAEDAAAVGGLTGWRRMALHLGVPAFGATTAMALGWGHRYYQTREFHTSWDEVAENYLSVLAWELGDAALGRASRYAGLEHEINGRRRFATQPLDGRAGFARRAGHVLSQGIVDFGNLLLTNLGTHRAGRVQSAANRMVREMIEATNGGAEVSDAAIRNHPYRSFIARQLAIQEIASPGSLDYYHDAFFYRMLPIVAGDEGSHRLIFIPRGNLEIPRGLSVATSSSASPSASRRDTVVDPAPSQADETPAEPLRLADLEAAEDTALLPRETLLGEAARRSAAEANASRTPADAWDSGLLQWWREQSGFLEFLHSASQSMRARVGRYPHLTRFCISFERAENHFSFSTDLNPTATGSRPRLQIVGNFDPATNSIILPPLVGRGNQIVIDLATGNVRDLSTPSRGPQPPPPPPSSARRPVMMLQMDNSYGFPRRVMGSGETSFAISPNVPGRPRHGLEALSLQIGDVAAFTEVGIDKHVLHGADPARAVNEDAFGVLRDAQGRSVLTVSDGMGGHGNGDHASAIAVRSTLENLQSGERDLADAMIRAHSEIQQFNAQQTPHGRAGAVATTARVSADGQVEVAIVGDTRLWVARRQSDGRYRIVEPYRPDSLAGYLREAGHLSDTLTMNASEMSSQVAAAMGLGQALEVVPRRDSGSRMQLLQTRLGEPLRPNDLLIMMSDGVADLFNRAQMEDALRGHSTEAQMLTAIQQESHYRLELYRSASRTLDGQRTRISEGSFTGGFIDNHGNIFNQNAGGQLIGHVGPDNLVCLIYRHRGSSGAAE